MKPEVFEKGIMLDGANNSCAYLRPSAKLNSSVAMNSITQSMLFKNIDLLLKKKIYLPICRLTKEMTLLHCSCLDFYLIVCMYRSPLNCICIRICLNGYTQRLSPEKVPSTVCLAKLSFSMGVLLLRTYMT